jgi:hypothetical protein
MLKEMDEDLQVDYNLNCYTTFNSFILIQEQIESSSKNLKLQIYLNQFIKRRKDFFTKIIDILDAENNITSKIESITEQYEQ